ncbi:Hypothetical protein PHPALM_16977 [Phytophthora palmivora]|uniref:Eukaryotic/viral aspartic protease n=1 Tax=Phytophthora palmivora TaxID=4796 RepID=A0A2P4XNE5_9STRA|nr:Hypothetical protein PHPALM_16977 [Phytophthora palmivora]
MAVDLQPGEIRGYWKQRDPDTWFKPTHQEDITEIQKSSQVKEIQTSEGNIGEYCKHYAPGKWLRQAKIAGKINNERGLLLLDTGVELFIVATAFARNVGCYIDTSQIQDCVGIGESVYWTEGRTRIKITIAGSLVYFFDIWVGDLAGQDAILVYPMKCGSSLAGVGSSTVTRPDSNRGKTYSDQDRTVGGTSTTSPDVRPREVLGYPGRSLGATVVKGLGKRRYLQIANIIDKTITLQEDVRVGIWLAGDIPRSS